MIPGATTPPSATVSEPPRRGSRRRSSPPEPRNPRPPLRGRTRHHRRQHRAQERPSTRNVDADRTRQHEHDADVLLEHRACVLRVADLHDLQWLAWEPLLGQGRCNVVRLQQAESILHRLDFDGRDGLIEGPACCECSFKGLHRDSPFIWSRAFALAKTQSLECLVILGELVEAAVGH